MAMQLMDKPSVKLLSVPFDYIVDAPPKKKALKLAKLKVISDKSKKQTKAKKERKLYETADKFVLRVADTVDPRPEYVLLLFKEITKRKERNKPVNKKHIAKIVKLNQRFVAQVARRYIGQGLCFEDLFQEGNIGMLRAIDKFDWRRGWQFSTYAEWWIKEGITRAIKNKSRLIRIPIQKQQQKVKVQKEYNFAYTVHHTNASSRQLAHNTGFTVAQVEEFATFGFDPSSLDAPISNNRDTSLAELLAKDSDVLPEQELEQDQDKIELYAALRQLPSHDARFIKRFYGLSGSPARTEEQMAEVYAMTKANVRKKIKVIQEQLRSLIDVDRINALATI